MKNVLRPLAKTIAVPLGLTTTASETDTAMERKIYGSGTTTLVFLKEYLNDIMNITKSLAESGKC